MAVSYSGIQLYNQCPAAFRYKYILKIKGPEPTPETAPALFRGKRLHQEIEDLLTGKRMTLSEDISFYQGFFESMREQGALPEEKYAYTADWKRCEFDADEAMIRGILDAIYLDGDHLHVWEFKSGKIYAEHEKQRALYALFGMLAYPQAKVCRVTNIYLDQRKNAVSEYSSDMVPSYQWVWERSVNKTQPPQPYPEQPSWRCKFCPYSNKVGGRCKKG